MNTILITGAGRGIGLALVKAYLAKGDSVIATYRSAAGLASLKALPSAASSLICLPLEVSDSQSIAQLANALTEYQIDVLIHNAGVFGGDRQSRLDIDFDQWKQALAVNTIAPIELTLALLAPLRRAPNAKVIAISSMMASLERAQPHYYAYRSSKAALNKALQCLAYDLKPEGILVCPIHPGWVQTDMGGAAADITVDECVLGLVPLVDRLTLADTGQFFQYNGLPMTW